MKHCSKCGEEKPLTEYWKQKSNKDGLYTYCRTCAYKQSRSWNSKNREAMLAYHVEYRKKNKEKIDAQIKKWHAENPEKDIEYRRNWKDRNRERVRKEHAEYKRKNRDKGARWAAKRRANLLKVSGYGNEELNELVLQEAYTVAKERTEATGVQHDVDHIIPLQGRNACGFHCWNNVQVIPRMENLKKANKLIEGLL